MLFWRGVEGRNGVVRLEAIWLFLLRNGLPRMPPEAQHSPKKS
jgi:hypothetical protein